MPLPNSFFSVHRGQPVHPWLLTAALALSVGLAYAFLRLAWLQPFQLQAVAAAALAFFVNKRLSKAAWHHLVPRSGTLEMPVLTFALLLLIGATGNSHSILFPLAYVHLFFLVLSTPVMTGAVTLGLILCFHFAAGSSLSPDWPSLISLPILYAIFLFAKEQRDSAQLESGALQESIERQNRLEWALRAKNRQPPTT